MSSFKELYDKYEELKNLSHEELVEKIGSWWAELFERSKDEIKRVKEGNKHE